MMKYIGTFRKVLFSAIILLLPGAVHAQFFDVSLPGKKMTLQQCFDLAEQQNVLLQAGRKTIERAKVMEGTAWDVDKTEVAFLRIRLLVVILIMDLPFHRALIFQLSMQLGRNS